LGRQGEKDGGVEMGVWRMGGVVRICEAIRKSGERGEWGVEKEERNKQWSGIEGKGGCIRVRGGGVDELERSGE